MKKLVTLLGFTLITLSGLLATPDRTRVVTDNLIGYIGDDLVILQHVYDNHGSHLDQSDELYLVIKSVAAGSLIVKSQKRIQDISAVGEYFTRRDFYYAMPDLVLSEYLVFDSAEKTIEYLGTKYRLEDMIPRDLKEYRVDHVECTYANRDFVFVILVLEDRKEIEIMRKVLLLRSRGQG